MGRTLEQSVVNPTYLEFFGLSRPPFAGLADSGQLFCSEQYSVLMEHLADATTNSDSLVVVCGADGSGKTTLLNRFVTSLGDQVSCVAINESCHNEEKFYNAFLTQIGFEGITGTARELQNITKEFLVCRGIAGEHILVILDNAHLTDPTVLEQIRRLCEIQIKDRRVLSVVLAGNADIVRVVDAPAMRQTKFHSHVVFGIRNYSEEETASYVWHRLRSAGGNESIKLPDDVCWLIHRYSGGIPHLINTLCNEALAEACSLESRVITEEIVRTAAERQQLVPHVTPHHNKGRRKTDRSIKHVRAVPETTSLETEDLLRQIASLNAQISDLEADKTRALQEIDARSNDVNALHDKLNSRTAEVEKLTHSLKTQNLALRDNAMALQNSNEKSKILAADLEEAVRARQSAQDELANATATVEELTQAKRELQTTVDHFQDDLRVGLMAADEQAVEISLLRHELASRSQDVANLERRLEDSQKDNTVARERIVALENSEELEEAKKALDVFAADLDQEIAARASVDRELVAAKATVDELNQLKQGLQATVRVLNADLRAAGERAIDIYMLETNATELKDTVETITRDLDSKNQAVADLEKQLAASQKENEALRRLGVTLSSNDGLIAEEDATAPDSDTRVYSSHVVAIFEKSIREVSAYKALRKFDPTFYDGLINTYEKLVGQDLTEKQVNDGLRSELVELMEKLLPRASDKAILAYGRLIVDQLDEFQLDGVEPCLTLMVPQTNPDRDTSPIFSERTKERELEILEMTLRTYKAERQFPAEKDVWPDLGPVFSELFNAFGAENVAALENSYDPNIDRILVCNVSRALYSGVLNFPKRNAADALRWLLST